jgi:hypothetical protein
MHGAGVGSTFGFSGIGLGIQIFLGVSLKPVPAVTATEVEAGAPELILKGLVCIGNLHAANRVFVFVLDFFGVPHFFMCMHDIASLHLQMPPVVNHMALPALVGAECFFFSDPDIVPHLDALPEIRILVGKGRTMAAAALVFFSRGMAITGDRPGGYAVARPAVFTEKLLMGV